LRYRTLLFDLDHTLFDSDSAEALAFTHALGRSDAAEILPAYRIINLAMWAAVEDGIMTAMQLRTARFEKLVTEQDLDHDPMQLADAFTWGLGNFGELYPGARQFLDALHGHHPMGLISNGLSEVQRARIERLHLARYFDSIVISSEVGCAKPGREIFDIAMKQLGSPDRDTAMIIGDSLSSDIRGGRNAGLATCWFNPHRAPRPDDDIVDHDIARLDALLGLV
jgi:YjjG family noncanonical pyrimidine nucleotidase